MQIPPKKNAQKRAKQFALHAQKMSKSSQKNICAKITQILRKKIWLFRGNPIFDS